MKLLPYENPKWEKNRKEILKIGYEFSNDLNVDSYIQKLKDSEQRKEDYSHYFACLSMVYHEWVLDCYLTEPNNPKIIDNTYRSGIAGVICQQLGGLHLKQWENIFHMALYKLVSVDCIDNICLQDEQSVLSCMLAGNFGLAQKMLDNIEKDAIPKIGSQYIEVRYLKSLYLAIIKGDEILFNKLIVKRAETYRHNPYDHAIIIDYPLVALIKIAKKYGIDYNESLAEIPCMMIDRKNTIQREHLKLPFADEASKRFDVDCGL